MKKEDIDVNMKEEEEENDVFEESEDSLI